MSRYIPNALTFSTRFTTFVTVNSVLLKEEKLSLIQMQGIMPKAYTPFRTRTIRMFQFVCFLKASSKGKRESLTVA